MPEAKTATDPVAFVIMIAPDHDLEWMALLLGASIRQFVTRPANIYFCAEPDHMARIPGHTRALIDKLDGTLRALPTQPVFDPPYKVGNKMLACTLDYDEERIIFLDSDMLFCNQSDLNMIAKGDVALQQEFGDVWTKNAGAHGQWDHLYKTFSITDTALAEARRRAPKWSHPYFNAGVVSFTKSSGFAARWLETALKIDQDPRITDKRPWLDQIALPIALMQDNSDLHVLPPMVNRRPSRSSLNELRLAHYHGLTMMRFSSLARVADRCARVQLGLRSLEHLLDLILRRSAKAQAARLGGKAPYAKVFGERNTGTNLIHTLLRDNFVTQPLEPRVETLAFFQEAEFAFGAVREFIETPRDLLHQATFDTLYGWKHARPVPDMLARMPRFENTCFICIYKHPAFWVKSMHARPYNEFHGPAADDFATFLQQPFAISERDMVDYSFNGAPLELYQEKLRGYLALKRLAPDNTVIVPYEEMLQQQDRFMELLTDYFAPGGPELIFPQKAAKPFDANKRGLQTTDYISKYAITNQFTGFDAKARAIFDAQLDARLFDELNKVSCFANEMALT